MCENFDWIGAMRSNTRLRCATSASMRAGNGAVVSIGVSSGVTRSC